MDVRVFFARDVVLEFLVAPAVCAEVVGPVCRVDGGSFELIRPNQTHPIIRRRRLITRIADADCRVIVPDGPHGDLLEIAEVPVDGVRQNNLELLIALEETIDDNLHLDGLLRLAGFEHEGAACGDKVLPRFRGKGHRFEVHARPVSGRLRQPHLEFEDSVCRRFERGDVVREVEFCGHRFRHRFFAPLATEKSGRSDDNEGVGSENPHGAMNVNVKYPLPGEQSPFWMGA